MGFQAHSELPRRESNCILPLSFGLSSLQPQSTTYRSLHYWVEPVGCYKSGARDLEFVLVVLLGRLLGDLEHLLWHVLEYERGLHLQVLVQFHSPEYMNKVLCVGRAPGAEPVLRESFQERPGSPAVGGAPPYTCRSAPGGEQGRRGDTVRGAAGPKLNGGQNHRKVHLPRVG